MMTAFAFIGSMAFLITLFGFQVPQSSVILIPDADGTIGEVSVSNQSGKQIINTAYAAVEIIDKNSTLNVIDKVDKKQTLETFQYALSAKPDKVKSYILHFISGSTDLTQESKLIIPQILEDIRARKVYEAYIVGHTDTKGTADMNYKLALERANQVKDVIEQHFSNTEHIQVKSYGEGNLLVPTDDNIDEPKNRRVEVEIH
jgi:outer membrane protein OmpA-like peptidoglycan-associated protein